MGKTKQATEKTPEETTAKPKGKNNSALSIPLRVESFLWKLKGCLDGLVDVYCRLTKIEPPEAEEMVSRKAHSLREKGNYGRAIDQYKRLIEMGKKDASIYYYLGICCEREAMDEEAEAAYEKAIQLDGNLSDAAYRLGLLAIKNDDAKTAVKHLGALASKEKKDSFDVLYNLGVAHDKAKEYEKAVDAFKRAIAIEPHYAKGHKRLGYAYDAMGKHEESNECFKKAMELEEV